MAGIKADWAHVKATRILRGQQQPAAAQIVFSSSLVNEIADALREAYKKGKEDGRGAGAQSHLGWTK